MIENILLEKKISTLLIEKRKTKRIVIGSPHHTPQGVGQMPCKDHEAGDENAGIIARRLAERMRISSIIACNYYIDSNKSLGTDYSLQIIQWKAKYLVEIHGHAVHNNCNDTCIEVSSGTVARKNVSVNFAQILNNQMNNHNNNALHNYNVRGDINAIRYKAKNSATITTDLWTPFHIELPPSIRFANPQTISDFTDCLAETIRQVCQ